MDLTGAKVLVTGGAGLIGSTIVDELLGQCEPESITVLDDLTRGTRHNLASAMESGKVTLVEGDIRDRTLLAERMKGVNAVFHQAAIRITRCASEPRECLEVLIDGTFNVLEAATQAGVDKVVAASSASVYGLAEQFPTAEDHHPYNNRTIYGVAKVTNEGFLRSFNDMYGLDYVALRYFNVYGPRMDIFGKYTEVLIRWLDCLDEGVAPKIFGDGKQTMDFVFSRDIARANVLAMQSDVTDAVFNVASGKETSLLELLKMLLKATGCENVEPEFLAERSVNPVPRRLADISHARDRLGFTAEVGLEEGLRELVEWRTAALQAGTMKDYVSD